MTPRINHVAVGFALVVSIVTACGAAAQRASAVERRCIDVGPCVPRFTSTVLIYVHDNQGAAIEDVTIAVVPPPASARSAGKRSNLETDSHGMAALSLVPGVSYRLDVTARPWRPVVIPAIRLEGGKVEAVSIRMELDESQLR